MPPAKETLLKIFKHKKIRFTMSMIETRCPLHDDAPVVKKRLEMVVAELASEALVNIEKRRQLLKLKRKLEKRDAECDLHLKQYAVQRSAVHAREANLTVGECLVYRDFVNQHNENGVMRYRTTNKGSLQTRVLNHFADAEACDAWFTADVWIPTVCLEQADTRLI
jgi:hypothetical protein